MKHLIFAALLVAPAVLAQDRPKSGPLDDARAAIAEKDTNGDQRLSVEELGAGLRIFRLLDRNQDGFVTAEELAPAPPRRGPRPGAAGRPGQPDQPFKPGKPGGAGRMDPERLRATAQAILDRLDRNEDGKLTADEMPGKGRLDLSQADRNGDSAVDLFELTAVLAQRGRGPGQPGGPQPGERLKRLDRNGDGAIDRAEWDAAPTRLPAQLFERLDGNQDGRIDAQEMKQAMRQQRGGRGGGWANRAGQRILKRFDADGDGKVSAQEWKLRKEIFDRLDADHDGFLTKGELAPRGPRARPDVGSGKDSAHFLEKFDRNHDGQVTPEEFTHERRFAEMDADGNGVLTQAEIEEAMDRRRTERAYDLFERFDLNGDGKITRDEFTGPAAAFERLDRNHDGIITPAPQTKEPE